MLFLSLPDRCNPPAASPFHLKASKYQHRASVVLTVWLRFPGAYPFGPQVTIIKGVTSLGEALELFIGRKRSVTSCIFAMTVVASFLICKLLRLAA